MHPSILKYMVFDWGPSLKSKRQDLEWYFSVKNIKNILQSTLLIPSIYRSIWYDIIRQNPTSQIAKFMGPTWGPPGSCRPQMGPMLVPWTLLSGIECGQDIEPIGYSIKLAALYVSYGTSAMCTFNFNCHKIAKNNSTVVKLFQHNRMQGNPPKLFQFMIISHSVVDTSNDMLKTDDDIAPKPKSQINVFRLTLEL